ncbi:MAG: DUF1501 domain-containing protein [Candidatus Protistobacter heckmanni]|nr:DUF1501 domain-containing protein [Candidatus Protistobacter heckmanni]
MDRRSFIGRLGLTLGASLLVPVGLHGCAVVDTKKPIARLPGPGGAPRPGQVIEPCQGPYDRAHAAGAGQPRMVVVFLRGAVDGLNVVAPYGDPDYARLRPGIALGRPGMANGALDLDGYFGLHPALAALYPYWQSGQLAFIHASGSPDPSRSHFDAQDFMETGTPGRKSTPDGWMNRLLAAMEKPEQGANSLQALAVGEVVPRILGGREHVANLASGRDAMRAVPIDQPALSGAFAALYNGLALDADRLARLMRKDPNVRLAFLAAGGWDTHVGQGATGQLAAWLRPLAEGLDALAKGLGPAFNDTVIVVVSEFGHTPTENGNGGTDHGHGNVMWLLGGNVRSRRAVYGQWPTLARSALYEGRDLAVTTDFRSVFAALCERHLMLPDRALEAVFPQAPGQTPLVGKLLV